MHDLRRFKAEFFKALSHPLRIAVLDALRHGEMGVGELSAQLQVEQSTLSQQLAILRGRAIVTSRKEGLNVYYSVADPAVFKLLDAAKQIFHNQLADVRALLTQIKKEVV